MNNLENKIQQLEKKIILEEKKSETKLLIEEMKKIGIEKLPYSYSALKQFIDAETMNFHYNKHYKGYVDKLNDALKNKKTGDKDLENIIKNISKYSSVVRNNAGGAFNHALFWNMLSPEPKKLKGELYNKIVKEFVTFNNFKKKFETIAKERFGSGWVWLILTPKGQLKIMSTSNQDNPLMNVIEGGGFPLLGLDLWEHAYYLKYRNKRDEYIKNFWQVVNWDFVSNLYEIKTKTNLLEQSEVKKLLETEQKPNFCKDTETIYFQELINNERIKKLYKEGINTILKSVYSEKWNEGNKEEMPGYYGIENEGRSVLNNLNTNFNTWCLLTKLVNEQIQDTDEKKFDFSKDENRNIDEVKRFLKSLDKNKLKIFDLNNEGFVNVLRVLVRLWNRGQKTEDLTSKKIMDYFDNKAKIEKVGGHGKPKDALDGIDVIVSLDDKKNSAQIKKFTNFKIEDNKIKIFNTGNVKKYSTDWMIFTNPNTKKILIFKNNPICSNKVYVFDVKSLMHEIE